MARVSGPTNVIVNRRFIVLNNKQESYIVTWEGQLQ